MTATYKFLMKGGLCKAVSEGLLIGTSKGSGELSNWVGEHDK